MKRYILLLLISLSCLLYSSNTATHQLTIGITPVNEIDVGRMTTVLIIDRGEDPNMTEVCDDHMTYSLTTNEAGKKIMGFIDDELPKGAHLEVYLIPPDNGITHEFVELHTYPSDLVTNLNRQIVSDLGLSYKFRCDPDFPSMPESNRTVTFILTDM